MADNGVTRCRSALCSSACVIFVHIFAPICFYQVVAFEDAFNSEVILLISLIKKTLLNYSKFRFKDSEEARVNSGYAYLLTDLQIFVK
jgi:hypothetical protein